MVVIVPGFNSHSAHYAWAADQLAARSFAVYALDLRGRGKSDGERFYVEKFADYVGDVAAFVAGHDIGLMVAYAYAAQFPAETERLVLMDAFPPGVEGWEAIYNNPAIWHFRFNGPTPEALVNGRERIYFEHFWNDFAADKTRSIPEFDRRANAASVVLPNTGHWVMEENPRQTMDALVRFLSAPPGAAVSALQQTR